MADYEVVNVVCQVPNALATIKEEEDYDDLSMADNQPPETNYSNLNDLSDKFSQNEHLNSYWSLEKWALMIGIMLILSITCIGMIVGLFLWLMIIFDSPSKDFNFK